MVSRRNGEERPLLLVAGAPRPSQHALDKIVHGLRLVVAASSTPTSAWQLVRGHSGSAADFVLSLSCLRRSAWRRAPPRTLATSDPIRASRCFILPLLKSFLLLCWCTCKRVILFHPKAIEIVRENNIKRYKFTLSHGGGRYRFAQESQEPSLRRSRRQWT